MKKNNKWLACIAKTALIAGTIYSFNRLVFFTSTMKEVLDADSKNYYNWRFGNIFYKKQGKGKPVLLIHQPEATCSGYEWERLAANLSKKYTVYTIDLPGCGRSDKQKMIYTNYLYVQAVNDFVSDIIKKETDVITSGDASSIAVMACHSKPELYGKLVFINPEPFDHMVQNPGVKEKLRRYLMEMPLIGTLYYLLYTSKIRVLYHFKQAYYFNSGRVKSGDVDAFYEAAHLGGADARFSCAGQIGYYTRMNIIYALKKIKHSMYIIGGAGVRDIDDTIKGYCYFNSAIEAVKISETSGMPHMEKPGEAADRCDFYLSNE
jgi:pimeloyl-ACP methyl ester carboxylesterase